LKEALWKELVKDNLPGVLKVLSDYFPDSEATIKTALRLTWLLDEILA
jgi:hypothetical protein